MRLKTLSPAVQSVAFGGVTATLTWVDGKLEAVTLYANQKEDTPNLAIGLSRYGDLSAMVRDESPVAEK